MNQTMKVLEKKALSGIELSRIIEFADFLEKVFSACMNEYSTPTLQTKLATLNHHCH